jgi:lipopolysaccharide biosynthesis glycosyltransferase
VIDAGLAVSNKQRLAKLVAGSGYYSIHWLPAPSAAFNGIQLARYHLSSYYRLALPEILDLERIIYLDADTLIFGCLGKLWEVVTAQNKPLLAIQDRETQTLADDSSALAEALGLECSEGYFNSGVLVLRLDLLRTENFTARVCAMLTQHGRLARFPDQSALNWYCAGRWVQLESRWNLPAWAFDKQDNNELPAICHYTNHAPWLKQSYSPSQSLFQRVAKELGFDLPKAEQGIGHAAWRALGQWALSPVRVGYQLGRFAWLKQGDDAQGSSTSAKLARYWWRYFIGGPGRALRYRRRIRGICAGSFSPFSRSSS